MEHTAGAEALVAELRRLGSERNRAGMARYGIEVGRAFGVPVAELRRLARDHQRDHPLALALWRTGFHEARILACLVDDPAAVTEAQLERWVSGIDSWDLCDQAASNLFCRTSATWPKAAEWAARHETWVRRAGLSLMVALAVQDKAAPDRDFLRLLPLVERAAFDERNFVKKAASWALRVIGKRSRPLHAAAVAAAGRIRQAAGERGGDAGARAARWVAADALRELRSEPVLARLDRAAARARSASARSVSAGRRPGRTGCRG